MRWYWPVGAAALGIGVLGGYVTETNSRAEEDRRQAARLGFERFAWFVERDSAEVRTYIVLENQLFTLRDDEGDGVLDKRCFSVGDEPLTRRVQVCYSPTQFDRAVYDWVARPARDIPVDVPHVVRAAGDSVYLQPVRSPEAVSFST